MSFDALAWAAKQSTGSSSTKLVLLGLAECASRPDAFAFPSKAALMEFSSLDRKTVIKALAQLVETGFIADTGKRMGHTQQVVVYRLLLPDVAEGSQKRDALKGSQNSHERVPKLGRGISKGTSTSRAKALSVSRETSIADAIKARKITADAATDWAVVQMGWPASAAKEEWLRFIDNCAAHGRGYIDWMAAWRNWCRSPYCKTVNPTAAATAYRREPLRV